MVQNGSRPWRSQSSGCTGGGSSEASLSQQILNPDAVAEALQTAMQMPLEERCERWTAMMEVLRRNNVAGWRQSFLFALDERSCKAGKRVMPL